LLTFPKQLFYSIFSAKESRTGIPARPWKFSDCYTSIPRIGLIIMKYAMIPLPKMIKAFADKINATKTTKMNIPIRLRPTLPPFLAADPRCQRIESVR